MREKYLFIFLIAIVAVFMLINLGIAITSAISQVQEPVYTDPVSIGELELTDLVTEGNLSSVGNDGENYTGDVDWYIFTSTVTATATITLSFDFGNNYDLFLYDANGSMLGFPLYDDNPEIFIYELSASTPYLICVAGWEGSPGDYTLIISPEEVVPIMLDFTDLTIKGDLSSVGNDGEEYIGDLDWHIFTATVPVIVTITLSFDPNNDNDYDLLLYDANGSTPLAGSIDYNPEILRYELAASTPYLICVAGWKGSPGDYTLTVSPEAIEISAKIDLPEGWSMISLPVEPESLKLSELFPGAVVVYGYIKGKGYVRVAGGEDLKIGRGYWILLNNERKYTLTGRSIDDYTLPVKKDGWDMIGGCTSPSRAVLTNGHIAVIYRFVNGLGYQQIPESQNMEAGGGYWIMNNSVMNQCELKVKGTDS